MEKLIACVLAVLTAAFAGRTALPAPAGGIAADDGAAPMVSLYTENAAAASGEWNSGEFTVAYSNGSYIRYCHQNSTGEKVRVYLCQTGENDTGYASMMDVDANSRNDKVCCIPAAGSGTYKIVIEAYVSGGIISGDVAVEQYQTAPLPTY